MVTPSLDELVRVIVPDLTPDELGRVSRLSPIQAYALGAARAAEPLIRARQQDRAAISAVLDSIERGTYEVS